jgi:DNA-binding LacI/PurR family transcriptional regulator
LEAAGLTPDPQLEHLGFFTVEGGAAATEELLSRPQPPTAIFAESDEMAYGALRVIRRRGLRVPDDVALIGFDDQPFSQLVDLSTVHQPVAEQALDVTTRLLALLSETEDELPSAPAVRLSTELVLRASTEGADH